MFTKVLKKKRKYKCRCFEIDISILGADSQNTELSRLIRECLLLHTEFRLWRLELRSKHLTCNLWPCSWVNIADFESALSGAGPNPCDAGHTDIVSRAFPDPGQTLQSDLLCVLKRTMPLTWFLLRNDLAVAKILCIHRG